MESVLHICPRRHSDGYTAIFMTSGSLDSYSKFSPGFLKGNARTDCIYRSDCACIVKELSTCMKKTAHFDPTPNSAGTTCEIPLR